MLTIKCVDRNSIPILVEANLYCPIWTYVLYDINVIRRRKKLIHYFNSYLNLVTAVDPFAIPGRVITPL